MVLRDKKIESKLSCAMLYFMFIVRNCSKILRKGMLVFIFPSVLPAHSSSRVQSCANTLHISLGHDCGYVPVGMFPSMIRNLVSQKPEGWKMIEKDIRKNRVQFRVGEDCDSHSYLATSIFRNCDLTKRRFPDSNKISVFSRASLHLLHPESSPAPIPFIFPSGPPCAFFIPSPVLRPYPSYFPRVLPARILHSRSPVLCPYPSYIPNFPQSSIPPFKKHP